MVVAVWRGKTGSAVFDISDASLPSEHEVSRHIGMHRGKFSIVVETMLDSHVLFISANGKSTMVALSKEDSRLLARILTGEIKGKNEV